jgi:toxin ParE1/3/4
MARARRTPQAKRDAAEIWRYIAMDSIDAAERWLERINRAIILLAEYPGIGARRDELATDLRSYPVGNHLIFYRRVPGGIQVIRIMDGRRNIPEAFGQN